MYISLTLSTIILTPTDRASQVTLSNIIAIRTGQVGYVLDYHFNLARLTITSTPSLIDCTVEFCYPTNDVFSPISPKSGVELDGGRYDESDGGIILGADDKVHYYIYYIILYNIYILYNIIAFFKVVQPTNI